MFQADLYKKHKMLSRGGLLRMADEATDTLIDDAEVVASHLFSKEAVENESFCTFWQFHIPVKYASHTLSDKSDRCT